MVFFPSPHPGVCCLLQSLDAAAGLAEGIAPPGLLVAEERERCAGLRVLKRRRDWLLGRWTAKNLLVAYFAERGRPLRLDELVIRADPDGSPHAYLARGAAVERLPLSLSISHSGAIAFCALTDRAGVTVGADAEMIEPRPLSLAEQFFTRGELDAVLARPAEERDLWITLVWSAKEAFLKCTKKGLRVDTRRIAVEIPASVDGEGWQPLRVEAEAGLLREGQVYQGWWRREGQIVLTLGIAKGLEREDAKVTKNAKREGGD